MPVRGDEPVTHPAPRCDRGFHRNYAWQCVELAQTAKAQHRALLLGMAETWVRLAKEVEADAELLSDDGAAKQRAG
jgi:hypothetical protein